MKNSTAYQWIKTPGKKTPLLFMNNDFQPPLAYHYRDITENTDIIFYVLSIKSEFKSLKEGMKGRNL